MTTAYYLWYEEGAKGPFTLGQLQSMWESGQLIGENVFSEDGGQNWYYLKDIIPLLEPSPALTGALQATARPTVEKSSINEVKKQDSTPAQSKAKWKKIVVGALVIIGFVTISGVAIYEYLDYNPEPIHNDYFDNSVRQAVVWLKNNLTDPSSLQIISWSPVEKRDDGYLVDCQFKIKNINGIYEEEDYRFSFDEKGNVTWAGDPKEALEKLDRDLEASNQQTNEEAVQHHLARVGMTARDVARSLGYPYNVINTAGGRDPDTKEIWQYHNDNWVGFNWNNEVNAVSDGLDFNKTEEGKNMISGQEKANN